MRRFEGDRLVLATHNRGKLAEFAALLAPRGVAVLPAPALGLAPPAETEATFVGNARVKAHAASRASGLPALGDDSGLEVEALGGAPGVHTADWAEGPGGRDFGRAMRRTRELLEAAGAPRPWRARFRCALVLAWPDGGDEAVEGLVEGQIVWPMRGAEGHGYDPIFLPDGHDRTFAEMTAEEKNAVSHRARAVRQLLARCFT